MKFGQVVKKKRQELGITQTALAKKVGLSQCFISKIENENMQPLLFAGLKIMKKLKIESKDFRDQKAV